MNLEKAVAILKLIPVVIAMIKSVEEFLPVSGMGKEKLELVRTTLESTYEHAKEVWPTLEKVISQLISLANAFGVFKKAA